MKLLVVCSSLDLATPLSATPAWWQLLKGLSEEGVDLAVTTYHGRAPDSLWWRAYGNPARLEGEAFSRARAAWRRLRPPAHAARHAANHHGESAADVLVREAARLLVAPRWRRHLDRMIRRERTVDAVLFLNVPPNHLRGVAGDVRRRHGIPVLFYDGDVPASLPAFQGFATGFRIYDGADVSEFDAVLCNSEGGAAALMALGARAVHPLHYAVDPSVYEPIDTTPDIDVFFYGHGAEYRRPWLEAMIAAPSRALPEADFVVRGHSLGDVGRARSIEDVPFPELRRWIARSRINLAITRETHAGTRASSTMRLFELAMMGACVVCNPCEGVEQWFEPGREIVLVRSAEEAIDTYRFLLAHDAERRRLGSAARRRALAEHTFRHRAAQLVRLLRTFTGDRV